jgi:hypothetical protein
MSLLCRLPHYANGLPEKWSISRLLTFDRVSYVWYGQLDGSVRDLLDGLSAEATRTGICPNHVRILRGTIADFFRQR